MTHRADDVFVAARGLVVAALFATLWIWLAGVVRQYDRLVPFTLPGVLRPFGAILLAAGAALAAWCVAVFIMRGRGTPAPFDPPQEFVAVGPYRYVRNPMYVGAILALVGGALFLASPSILVLAGLFWILAHGFVVLFEEPGLERRFGKRYTEYRRQVHRWVPRVRPSGR